jgi:quinol monooxygenase YgiN
MPVVVATITPIPEHRAEVREALLAAIPQVHEEDGCQLYALHENADTFVFVERWSTGDALAVHSGSPALRVMGKALAGKTAGAPVVVILESVPAGDPSKGALPS